MTGDEMNMHGWLCVALIRASPALLAAPSGLTPGSLHPSPSRGQRPANGSCLQAEEECEEEGEEPESPWQGLWLLEAPRHCSCSWMRTHNRAYASAETFPSQPHHLKGGREAQRDLQNKVMVSAANTMGICRLDSVPTPRDGIEVSARGLFSTPSAAAISLS